MSKYEPRWNWIKEKLIGIYHRFQKILDERYESNQRNKYISDLFQDEPKQWGLRGDPYLWSYLKKVFANVKIPNDKDLLYKIIVSKIEDILGDTLQKGDNYYVEMFSNGGMSSGYISGEFWIEVALPLLSSKIEK